MSKTANSAAFARGDPNHAFAFTRLDVPGAFQTAPSGINAQGQIVGWYFKALGGPASGFIYDDGEYTTVVYPGAAFTQLRGISAEGDIVGTYRMAGEPPVNTHGFILAKSGEFIPVNYPGHTNTIAQRILPDGTILGCYHDGDQGASMHGMTKGRAGFSEISTFASMSNGATPGGGKVVGLFTDRAAGKGRAYLIEDGVFTAFDAPGSDFTAAWDISPNGTIVGLFEDAAAPKQLHGYVLERGEFTTIDVPNSAYTDVFGINPRGDIVGKFRETANGPFHGYVATRRAGHGGGNDYDDTEGEDRGSSSSTR
ncbi:MAG: hypothetical protein ABI408_08065 [Gemmatimonadaceae bacterium]